MTSPKILWITNYHTVPADGEYRSALAEFDLIPVSSLHEAYPALAGENVESVVLQGPISPDERLQLLDALRELDSFLPVVFFDPQLSAAEAIRLHGLGAHNCLGERDGAEALRDCLDHAIEDRRCQRRRMNGPEEPWREFLVGESPSMQRVIDIIRLVGPRRSNVLISGESGTGKELAARALHLASPRANQNLVTINCTALPEHLLEAEMFGHVRGAFTGAVNSRVGRFEQAHKGTLFLDEIGDMPIEMQAKLLRVLQDREFQRLGSSETVKVDVRVIAASNVNLEERVRQGRFREDLFYRLNVVPIRMPALRERDGDLPLLVYHLIQKICQREGISLRRLVPETMAHLKTCPWPGNVRQLENALEMAVALSGERDILVPRDFGVAENAAPKVIAINSARLLCRRRRWISIPPCPSFKWPCCSAPYRRPRETKLRPRNFWA